MRVRRSGAGASFVAAIILAVFLGIGTLPAAASGEGSGPRAGGFGLGAALFSSGYTAGAQAWPRIATDGPTASINDVSQAEGNGPGTITFTVTLDNPSDQEITINFATTNGSATAPSDYEAISLDILTFEPGETEKSIVVNINGDLNVEADETFSVNLTAAENAVILDGQGVGTILNDDGAPAGTLQFSAAQYSVGEGAGTATITVTRQGGSFGAVGVNYATSNGSATAGQDYTAATGTITWADGDTSPKTFTIPIIDDGVFEGSETLNVTLSSATGGSSVGAPGSALLTILDNEGPPLPSISINDVSQSEGNLPGQMTFLVNLSAPSSQTVSVNFATANGTATSPADYAAASGVVSFAPGESQKSINVSIVGDPTVEPDETFFVNLTNSVNSVIADTQGVGTIINDDVAGGSGTLQFSSLTYSVGETSPTATITVTRAGGSSGSVSVNYATSNGTATAGQDYTATSGVLTWADGDSSAKNFTIAIIDDVSLESNETINVALSNPLGGAALGSPGTSVVTIVDNDSQPSLAISDIAQAEGNAQNQMVFNVTLSAPSTQTVTVNYSTSNGTATAGQDYLSTANQLTFNPGETSKPVAITILGDFVIEPDESFFVDLSGAVNAPIFDAQGVGTIVNDDGAGTIQFGSPSYSVNEATSSATITVVRTGGLAAGVTVQYFTIDGSATSGVDFNRVSGTLTFAPNQATQTFTIPIINDAIDEPDETVNLALDNPTGGATLGSPVNAILTIVDDDDSPSLSINDVSVNEGDSGFTALTFTISLTGQSSQPVTIDWATANGTAVSPSDYVSVLSTAVTFLPGQTSKQVTVQVKGDFDREPNETLLVNLSGASGATIADAQGIGTIVNDDAGGTLRFNSENYLVGEPSGSITVTVQRSGGLASGVTVNYTTSNDSAIAGQDYTAVSGTLTFEGGQTSKTFTIPIANDGIPETDETFNLILSDATGGATLGVPNTAVVTITDVGPPASGAVPFDYDGDRKADLSVRRPSDNMWYILRGTAGYMTMQFGESSDLLVPADYDGDHKTDIAVFRPSTGTWFIFNSATQTFTSAGWGESGDLPAPADHDGDGKADLVVFRPSTGTWYRKFSANNSFSTTGFGVAGDKPVVGDFDGDGRADIALFRPSDNNWYILKTGFGFFVQTWGQSGDVPVAADYDGDGKTDVAVWRPTTGQWFRIRSSAGFDTIGWGTNGDKPVPADYDGDGKADVAVFRPSNANWYVIGSTSGISQSTFGLTGDQPTEGAFIY